MTDPSHQYRYRAVAADDGYLIVGGPDRRPVRVTWTGASWQACPTDPAEHERPRRFGLFDVRHLAKAAAEWTVAAWTPRPSTAPAWRLRAWAARQAQRSVSRVVADQHRRLLPSVDPLVARTQRAVFAAACSSGSLVCCPAAWPPTCSSSCRASD